MVTQVGRPLLWLTAAFAAGAAAGNAWRGEPGTALAAGVLLLALAALACARGKRAGPILLLAAVGAAGLLVTSLAWSRLGPGGGSGDAQAQVWNGTPARWVSMSGVVAGEPQTGDSGYHFVLRASAGGLYWRQGERVYVSVREATGSQPVPGDPVRVSGMLSRPAPPGNPGQFDFPLYLAGRGIRYVLGARAGPFPSGEPPNSPGFGSLCRETRDSLTAGMEDRLSPDQAALLDGLLFGDTSRLPEQIELDFRRAGVFHILAVSGSNVAFIAGGFLLLVGPILRLAGLRGPAIERRAWPATALVLAAYAVMSGAGPSVVRATLMAEAGLLYLWLGRRRDVSGPLCLAAMAMIVANPLVILDVGFQLSFAATIGILTIYPPLWRWLERLTATPSSGPATLPRHLLTWAGQAGAVSLAAQAAVVPILACHFGEVSIAGLLANIVIVPLAGVALTVGLAAGAVNLVGAVGHILATPLFAATSALLGLTTGSASVFAHLPWASVVTGAPAVSVLLLYYVVLVWVVRGARAGRALKRAAISLIGVLAVSAAALGAGPAAVLPAAEVVFLDVGQGDAALIRLPGGRAILVDGGPEGAGANVVGPYLRHTGQGRLDLVFVSHFHDDHVGGLLEVIRDPSITVGQVVIGSGWLGWELSDLSREFLEAVAEEGVPVREVSAGDNLETGGGAARLTVVWPPAPSSVGTNPGATASSRENNASLVLRLESAGLSVLFAGDLETTGEEILLGDLVLPGFTRIPSARVLKVGHHGSQYASGPEYLEAVDPQVAVVSVGANSFGHPSSETLVRLENSGAAVFQTRLDGAVTLTPVAGGVSVRGYRSGREVFVSFTRP